MDLLELEKGNKKRHPWEISRFKVVKDLMRNILNNSNLTVLDMGCGDTYFMEQLSTHFPNLKLLGVDSAFNDELLQNLNTKFKNSNIKLFTTLEEAVQDDVTKIDVVLLLDVIEHIEDDISFLKYLLSFPEITSNTLFIITVPAYQFLFSSHDIFLKHFRRYDNKKLENNISEAGLESIETGYFFYSLLMPRMASKLLEKLRKNDEVKGIGGWNGSSLFTSIITNFLYFDFRVSKFLRKFRLKLPGLSSYVICKKHV